MAYSFFAESPMRPSTPKASAASLTPPLLRLLPGGNEPVPGRDFSPAEDQRLFTAHPIIRLSGTRRVARFDFRAARWITAQPERDLLMMPPNNKFLCGSYPPNAPNWRTLVSGYGFDSHRPLHKRCRCTWLYWLPLPRLPLQMRDFGRS